MAKMATMKSTFTLRGILMALVLACGTPAFAQQSPAAGADPKINELFLNPGPEW